MNYSENGILIIGGDSKIGNYLYKYYKSLGANVFKTSRRNLNKNDIYLNLEDDFFDINLNNIKKVIFCAAITSIDQCEFDSVKSHKVNVENTIKVIRYLIKNKIYLIFLSTSQIFSDINSFEGNKEFLIPKSEYARQKLIVEQFLNEYGHFFCIIRLSKVIDENLKLFKEWISELKLNNKIFPFYDMNFSPIYISYAVSCLKKIEELNFCGVINISATDKISYYDAANYLAEKLDLNIANIKPISYKEKNIINYQKNTILDLSNFIKLNIPLQNSLDSLDCFVNNGELLL